MFPYFPSRYVRELEQENDEYCYDLERARWWLKSKRHQKENLKMVVKRLKRPKWQNDVDINVKQRKEVRHNNSPISHLPLNIIFYYCR